MQYCNLYQFLVYDDKYNFKLLEGKPKIIMKITQAVVSREDPTNSTMY